MLKETAPHISRVLAITASGNFRAPSILAIDCGCVPRLGLEATAGKAQNAAEIDNAIASFAQKPNGGLIALPHALVNVNAPEIFTLAQQHRLPDILGSAELVAAGGLVSYGVDREDHFRSTAEYVDRILKGTKPADLPVQLPTKYQLVVNLKTAKAIGLTIPESFLLRADEVIDNNLPDGKSASQHPDTACGSIGSWSCENVLAWAKAGSRAARRADLNIFLRFRVCG